MIKKNNDKKLDDLKNIPKEYIPLINYLSDKEIKTSDFLNSKKYFKKEFNNEIKTIKLEYFNLKNIEYLERLHELYLKISDFRDRSFGKKIVNSILGRYGLVEEIEYPPTFKKSEEFFSKQKKFLNEKFLLLKSAKEYKNISKEEELILKKSIYFELKLFRLFSNFIYNCSWFTANYLIKILKNFEEIKYLTPDYSYLKSVSSLLRSEKTSVQLMSIINEYSLIINEINTESLNHRRITDELRFTITEKEKAILEMNEKVLNLEKHIEKLNIDLAQQKDERESDKRISSVGNSEIKSKIQKTVSSLMRDEINLLTEMLSDGNDFNNRALRQVNSLRQKLEELLEWK